MSQKKQTTMEYFMKLKQPAQRKESKEGEPYAEKGTPVLSDKEYDEENKRVGKQLLYLMPYHISKLWPGQQRLLAEVANTKEIKPFLLYQTIEKVFATHFSSSVQINFKNLQDALNRMPEASKALFLGGAVQNAARLALKSESYFPDFLPMLIQQENLEVVLSYEQVAVIVANMFFCTFHLQANSKYMPRKFVFAELFAGKDFHQEKLKFFINYFLLIHAHGTGQGSVRFERRVNSRKHDHDIPPASLCKVTFKKGALEDEHGASIVDFANKFIGGGILGNGATQEELLFLCYPEMLPSVIITEMLQDNEVLLISGVRRFNHYAGYSDALKWKPLDRIADKRNVICLDAFDFRKNDTHHNYLPRELNKCLTGFRGAAKIATGRWGCGVFGGELIEKFIIQWIAASTSACQELVYYDQGQDYDRCYKWGQLTDSRNLYRKLENYRHEAANGEFDGSLVDYLIYY